MNNIEMILKLMQQDLNAYQLSKLKNVLEIILKTTRNSLPNNELIERFVQNKKLVGLKDTSMTAYVAEVKLLAKYKPDKNLCEMTTADIKDYLADYTATHKIGACTVQTKIRCLSSFYDFLVNEEFIERNPTTRIERVMVEKKIKKALSEAEIEAIRNACETIRDRAFMEFLYSTGCRISEALSLNVVDVNFSEGEVVVFGKGHKERVVYLSEICIKYLHEYFEDRDAQPNEPLFTHHADHTKRMTPRNAQLLLKDLGEKSGVDNVHPHRFRRTMATHAMEHGMPIEQIKEVLGHSRLDTTMIYCNVSSGKVKASFKNIFDNQEDTADRTYDA